MYTFLMKSAQEISVVITDLMAVLRVRGEEREKVPKWKALHYLGTIIQRDLRKIRGEGDKKGADYEWKGLEVPD
jgi:hypothetical protein